MIQGLLVLLLNSDGLYIEKDMILEVTGNNQKKKSLRYANHNTVVLPGHILFASSARKEGAWFLA